MALYHWLQGLPLWVTIPALWVGLSVFAGAVWALCLPREDETNAEPDREAVRLSAFVDPALPPDVAPLDLHELRRGHVWMGSDDHDETEHRRRRLIAIQKGLRLP